MSGNLPEDADELTLVAEPTVVGATGDMSSVFKAFFFTGDIVPAFPFC